MTETAVSASHFRVHFKEIANRVARGGQRYTVERHGLEIVAVVSLEDLEFLHKHGRGTAAAERPAEAPPLKSIELDHPDRMSLEDIEAAYAQTKGSTDRRVIDWRGKAWVAIKIRRGKPPKDDPFDLTPWMPASDEGGRDECDPPERPSG